MLNTCAEDKRMTKCLASWKLQLVVVLLQWAAEPSVAQAVPLQQPGAGFTAPPAVKPDDWAAETDWSAAPQQQAAPVAAPIAAPTESWGGGAAENWG